ncbi:MAG: phosphotransferase [Candidatus Thorarchaeota archaeon]
MDSSALLRYLQSKFTDRNSLQIVNYKDITSGWETQIYAFDLRWEVNQKEESEHLIVRVYAPGISEKTEHEARVMKQLSTMDYPVPMVHITETDESLLGKPFMIMDRITGSTLEDKISVPNADFSKWLRVFSELFVKLHNLDWTVFLSDPNIIPKDDPYFIINTMLSDYRVKITQYDKEELLPIVEWLETNANRVPCYRPSVTHGDFHPMNIMIDDDELPYVIDWGAAGVRDFRMDLAWTLLLTRAYSTQENHDFILKGYEDEVGHQINEIEYFEVLAILRRLFDVLVSMDEGATSRGMREGAVELIREQMGHVKVVYSLLVEMTEIQIPEVESWIDSFL